MPMAASEGPRRSEPSRNVLFLTKYKKPNSIQLQYTCFGPSLSKKMAGYGLVVVS